MLPPPPNSLLLQLSPSHPNTHSKKIHFFTITDTCIPPSGANPLNRFSHLNNHLSETSDPKHIQTNLQKNVVPRCRRAPRDAGGSGPFCLLQSL